MVDIQAVIEPFIPSLNRGTPVEVLIPPIMEANPTLDEMEVKKALLLHIEPVVAQTVKEVSNRPKINLAKYRDAPRKKYHKIAENLTDIVEVVDKAGEGISKTGILQALRKDGSYWRPKMTRWLHDLCEMGVIQKDNNRLNPRYYSFDSHVENREREIHRRIVEALQLHGQMPMPQLAIKIGRNGGSNRKQVSYALEDLEREGFVRMGARSRWAWIT